MSYYMGDFYRGDPGIGSFFTKLGKSLVGGIPVVGPALTPIFESFGRGAGKVAQSPAAAGISAAAGSAISKVGSAIVKHPVTTAAAGAAVGGMIMGGAGERLMTMGGGAPVRGMHPCKGMRPGHKPRPCKHGAMVPNRRMNPFNPRAARRASRRLHSLVRHYRKYIGFVSARRPKGRPFMKKRKK